MPNFWKKLKPLPIARVFLKATDVDEVAADKLAEATGVVMTAGLANLQELRGRKIVLRHEIYIDDILGDPK